MKHKYNASKNEYNGIKFDSKKECNRYKELLERQEKGEISDLRLQVKYVLIPAQRHESTYNSRGKEIKGKLKERECTYIADFEYLENGEKVVEDVKGYRYGQAYALYVIKRKLMLYQYGISIKEI